MSLLPFPNAHRIDPHAALEARSRRLAQAVEACSRRRDVRERRSQIVLIVQAAACPLGCRARRPWYVPGAAARLGARGIARAWRVVWGEEPPTVRTIRSHLGALERACVLVRAPGAWLPAWTDPEHPERRPRYPDSFHLLEDDRAAEWWATIGRRRLEDAPRARQNPGIWARLFGAWRSEAARFQLELDFDGQAPPAEFAQELARGLFGPGSVGREELRPTTWPRPSGAGRRPSSSWPTSGRPAPRSGARPTSASAGTAGGSSGRPRCSSSPFGAATGSGTARAGSSAPTIEQPGGSSPGL